MKALDKVVRILTIPPLVTGLMVLLLYRPAEALSLRECLVSLLCLLLIPALAYPAWELLHREKEDRRSGQRRLALLFSAAGYALGFLWTLLVPSGRLVRILFSSYILSIAMLLLCNHAFGFRASGHACSATAPLVFLSWQLHPLMIIPCLFVVGGVYCSSLRLGRHTLAQLLSGSAISAAAWLASVLILPA